MIRKGYRKIRYPFLIKQSLLKNKKYAGADSKRFIHGIELAQNFLGLEEFQTEALAYAVLLLFQNKVCFSVSPM